MLLKSSTTTALKNWHFPIILFIRAWNCVCDNTFITDFYFCKNPQQTWWQNDINDAPASLALDLVILLPIVFLFSMYRSSFSYVELALVPLLLLLLAFCAAWTSYAFTKQHGKDGSSCNGLNLNGQQKQRQVKTGRKEPESKPNLIYMNCPVSWWEKVGCCPKSNSYYLSSEGWLAPSLRWQSKSVDK